MEREKMENRYTSNNEEIEIDLKEIFELMLRKIWIIILSGITVGLIMIVGTMLFIDPTYESTTKIYVLNKQDSSESITTSDMQSSLYLTKDYIEMIQSRTVTEGVIAKLGLDLTHEELLSKMSVSSTTDTRVISITIKDTDPYRASEIANAVREISAGHIREVMNVEAVNVVDTANIPSSKSGPSLGKNGVIGGMLGCVLAAGIILVLHLTNDTIQTQEDVERYLGLSVIGTIPLAENEKKSKKQKKNKKGRKR